MTLKVLVGMDLVQKVLLLNLWVFEMAVKRHK